MTKRLIYVVNTPWFFISHRLVLAQEARRRGYEVTVLTPDGPGVADIHSAGFEWRSIPLDRGGMNPLQDVRTIIALVCAYREIRPAIVHHVTPKPVIYGTLAARLARVPQVVNAISGMGYLFTAGRGARSAIGRLLYRFCVRHRNMKVIVQNREDFTLIQSLGLVHSERLVLIPGSGVDVDTYTPTRERPANPLILQTSRMLADKGVREFIEAARIVRVNRPEARFVLVGDIDPGNPSSLSTAELREAEHAGIVEWWGPQTDIPSILHQATVYCLPSYREGLPKSLIEAAAAGLPLITTNTSGCAEVVEHERNGLLVPVGDAAALADAICRLIDDGQLASRLALQARRDAETRFNVDVIIDAQIALYSR